MRLRRFLSFYWYWIRRLCLRLKYKHIIIRKNTSDFKVFEQIFLFREYNIKIPLYPKLIIDAGANVGYASVYFSERFPKAKIIALEPENSNFEVLLRNIKNLPNVIPIQKGLWFEKTMLFIENLDENKWSFELTPIPKEHGIKIETCTVPELINLYGKIDILKIDVEGAEKEIFEFNSTEWVKSIKLIIVETHDHKKKNCSEIVHSCMTENNFLHFKHGENEVYINQSF